MRKNRIGKTDIEATHLSFGGIKLHPNMPDKAENIVSKALDLGINYIDTARCYGQSEVLIGAVMKERRSQCYLSSKSIRRKKSETAEDIDTSLRNLNTDMIDIYFCHDISRDNNYDIIMSESGSLAAIKEAQKAGKIRYTAISTHRADIAIKAINTGEFDVIMLPINLFDQEFITDVVPVALKEKVGIVGMKPLAGGAFKHPQIALRYSLAQDVEAQLVGISSIAELEEDFQIADSFKPLSESEMEELKEESMELGKDFCRQCGYCLPCTVEIDIPKVFLYERYAKRFWLDDFAKEQYAMLEMKGDECVECGKCEDRCPYELPIIEKMAAAHESLAGKV
ncbi:aldo/keto reductase [Candidatus Poribacteria bacterium]|nr:aldo/keto reductase [Candidatus Poribacteria bacterium]